MSELVTTLTERGQVSIPAKIRRDLRLAPGVKIHWHEISDHECRIFVETGGPGAEAMIGHAATFRKTRPADDWMEELRAGEGD